MAGPGVTASGGFSYAQAAKGRAPAPAAKLASSEGASGVATPASNILAEMGTVPGSNWADDVELSVGDKQAKPEEVQEEQKEQSKPVEAKGAVERAKTEEKAVNGSSGVSSPDMAASATSNDDSSTGQNGSSQTSWEAKSQASEPAQQAETPVPKSGSWITARAERQSSNKNDTPTRGGKRNKGDRAEKHEKAEKVERIEEPAPTPVVLTEAPQPTFNPWAKRAEDNKVKLAAMQQAAPKPTSSPSTGSNSMKENQAPRNDSKRKSASISGLANGVQPTSNGEAKKPTSSQGKRTEETRPTPQQKSKPAASTPRAEVQTMNYAKPNYEERQSLPNLTATPTVKDEVAWPTPDTAPALAQDKPRKPATEKDTEEKDDDSASTGKPRKKQEWKTVPVVPNILWETPGMSEKTAGRGGFGGEGRGRGGSARGRGGPRGAPNGVSVGDRIAARTGGQAGDDSARRSTTDTANDAVTPSPMQRAPSASSWTEPKAKGQGSTEAAADGAKQGTTERRGKSPRKADANADNAPDGERIPQPIPRRPSQSQGTQTEPQMNGTATPVREGVPIRMVPSDNRKENRNGENWNGSGSGRGSKRGGRGRGGSREFVNGHHSAHSLSGNVAPEFAAASPFGVPQSPSFPSRGHHTFPGSARGNWRGGNPRATSIPMDGFYNRYPAYPAPVQPLAPEMYAFQGYPMAAQPYNPMLDTNYLFACVGMQIEYYFSIDNLLKDMFLRKNMDSQGFVYLDVIGSFNRIKQITQDRDLLKQVCLQHECVEIRVGEDGKERLRKIRGWDQFVLPMEERFPSAKTDGPTKLERPEQRMPNVYGPHQMNPHGSVNFMPQARPTDRRPYDQYAMMNGAARGAFFPESFSVGQGEMPNGDEMRGRATKSPVQEGNINPQSVLGNGVDADAEPDVFPEQALEQLTVCVRMSARRAPYHTAASRTFSNGSIDSRTIHGEMEKQGDGHAKPASDGEKLANGVNASSDTAATSASASTSPERNANELSVFWVKDHDNPLGTLPNDLTHEPYVQLRYKALEQRSHAATGTCPYDLEVLYQFWSHFLIRNFNNRMYTEFKFYAETDAKERHSASGKKNLIQYYGQALSSANVIPTRVLKDYIESAKADSSQDDSSAFTQLRSAWRNGALNLRNRKKLADTIDDSLKAQLEA